ncbi:MAG: hypothetical protein WBN94_11620 [Methanothrix sp.]
MRKILAITVALMIAAIVLMPALGFTNQAAGNQSYSAKSGNHVEYSFKTLNVPAHNLTPDMVVNKYSFKSASVQSTRMPYSFQQGSATTYSLKLIGVENAVAEGMKTKKPVAKLGSMNKEEESTSVAEPVATPVVEPVATPEVAPVAAPVVEPADAPVNETLVVPVNETAVEPVAEVIEPVVAVNATTPAAINATTNATINATINATTNATTIV